MAQGNSALGSHMSQSITPVLFGTTAGLELKLFPSHGTCPEGLQDNWIELKSDDLTLLPDFPLFYFHRRQHQNQVLTWIGGYWSAREIGYARPGGYAGAGLWLSNITVNEQAAVQVIQGLYQSLASLALSNGQFQQKLSDLKVPRPAYLELLIESASDVLHGCSTTGKRALFQSSKVELNEILEWAQRRSSASIYSEVLIGSPQHFPIESKHHSREVPSKSLAGLLDQSFRQLEHKLQQTTQLQINQKRSYEQERDQLIQAQDDKVRKLKNDIAVLEDNLSRTIAMRTPERIRPHQNPLNLSGSGLVSDDHPYANLHQRLPQHGENSSNSQRVPIPQPRAAYPNTSNQVGRASNSAATNRKVSPPADDPTIGDYIYNYGLVLLVLLVVAAIIVALLHYSQISRIF